MKKRIIKIVLTLSLILTMCFVVSLSVGALEATGQCGDDVYYKFDENTGTLTISGTGETYSYDESPFCCNLDIKYLVVEKGVTKIADEAFYMCSNLQNIDLPNTIKIIGRSAFEACSSLKNINFPESLEKIEYAAFRRCYNLKFVEIPGSVETIGTKAFADCEFLEEVKINEGVNYIGNSSFELCFRLCDVKIADSVSVIDEHAFSSCISLINVVLPKGLTEIKSCAFQYCNDLETVTMSNQIAVVDSMAFNCSEKLKDIYFLGTQDEWEALNLDAQNITIKNARKHYNYIESQHIGGYIEHQDATCTENGYDRYVCSCGYDINYIIEAPGHSYIRVQIIDASCTQEGFEKYSCYSCKDSYVKTIERVPHWYTGDWAIERESTCSEEGIMFKTCLFCGDKNKIFIDKLPHSEIIVSAIEPTCTTTGLTEGKKCSICGETTVAQQMVTKKSHTTDSGTITKSATCTAAGTKTYKCKTCKAVIKTETIKATGKHTSDKGTVTQKATYTTTGTKTYKCTVCKATLKTETIAKLTLGKVSGLKAKKVKVAKSSEITLTWNKVTGAEKYEVYQQNGKSWKKIKTTSSTSYTVKKLSANKSYKFKVRAVVDGASGAYSTVLTVKTVPATTSKLTLKAGSKQLTASWKSVSDISGYEVQYSTSSKMKNAKTVKVKKSSKKTTIKKLKKGKKYYVRVRTYKTVNGKKVYSSWSTVKNVKVK